jgi:hypothetical protein
MANCMLSLRIQHRRLEFGGTRRQRVTRQPAKAIRVEILERDADDPAPRNKS